MGEFEQKKDLRRLFLRIVYERSEGRPERPVALARVAEEIQNYTDTRMQNYIDTSIGSDFVDEMSGIAMYLGDQGWLKKQANGYGILSITASGIDEVERGEVAETSAPVDRSSTPVDRSGGRRELRRRFLEVVYDLAGGSPVEWVYWRNVAPRLGLDAEDRSHKDEAIAIAEYLQRSGLINIKVREGTVYTITAKGIDEVERGELQAGPTSPRVTPDEFSNAAAVG